MTEKGLVIHMKKSILKKSLATTLVLGLAVSSVTGCGSSSKGAKKTEDGKKVIRIGSGNS